MLFNIPQNRYYKILVKDSFGKSQHTYILSETEMVLITSSATPFASATLNTRVQQEEEVMLLHYMLIKIV